MIYKAMYKSELAEMAGVSSRTFRRWLQRHRGALEAMGVSPKTQLLPPVAVKYVCEMFCIDI